MITKRLHVLIIGSGGRESTLFWKIAQSPLVGSVLCAPGNGGIPASHRRDVSPMDFQGILRLCKTESIDLVVVGPEAPLCAGVVDYLAMHGIKAFGPRKTPAQLEASKVDTKILCYRLGIPTAEFDFSGAYKVSEKIIKRMGGELVIKADPLCDGKGVFVCSTEEQALAAAALCQTEKKFGKEGERIVIERRLRGRECSFMVLCDGTENCIMLPLSRDYKRAQESDRGENTGGTGAYSPLSDVDSKMQNRIMVEIIKPILRFYAEIGHPYQGVLYAGIMITEDGPMLLEINVRFGDPETQVVLPRIESDIVPYLLACTERGGLAKLPALSISQFPAVCTVAMAEGYPGPYSTGALITGMPNDPVAGERRLLFHAGTEQQGNELVTSGGRVLCSVGLGWTVPMAKERSLETLRGIQFDGMTYRRDIAQNVQ